jgi:hypothetical protein
VGVGFVVLNVHLYGFIDEPYIFLNYFISKNGIEGAQIPKFVYFYAWFFS